MCTDARPVRVDARLARKSSTAFSIRVLSCCWISLRAGILDITETAIVVFLDLSGLCKQGHASRLRLLACMVGRPHQRPRLYVAEAHPEGLFAHIRKLLRRVIARHRQGISGWTQVLPNGQHNPA